ncbi:hypothetical protein HDU97_006108 [Phlyctochytrium planicorne]|nr:hypothetical protein HDU97_006108 [Phlyctochytrium planicorne]
MAGTEQDRDHLNHQSLFFEPQIAFAEATGYGTVIHNHQGDIPENYTVAPSSDLTLLNFIKYQSIMSGCDVYIRQNPKDENDIQILVPTAILKGISDISQPSAPPTTSIRKKSGHVKPNEAPVPSDSIPNSSASSPMQHSHFFERGPTRPADYREYGNEEEDVPTNSSVSMGKRAMQLRKVLERAKRETQQVREKKLRHSFDSSESTPVRHKVPALASKDILPNVSRFQTSSPTNDDAQPSDRRRPEDPSSPKDEEYHPSGAGPFFPYPPFYGFSPLTSAQSSLPPGKLDYFPMPPYPFPMPPMPIPGFPGSSIGYPPSPFAPFGALHGHSPSSPNSSATGNVPIPGTSFSPQIPGLMGPSGLPPGIPPFSYPYYHPYFWMQPGAQASALMGMPGFHPYQGVNTPGLLPFNGYSFPGGSGSAAAAGAGTGTFGKSPQLQARTVPTLIPKSKPEVTTAATPTKPSLITTTQDIPVVPVQPILIKRKESSPTDKQKRRLSLADSVVGGSSKRARGESSGAESVAEQHQAVSLSPASESEAPPSARGESKDSFVDAEKMDQPKPAKPRAAANRAKSRPNHRPDVTASLFSWLMENQSDPYPSEEVKRNLAASTGLRMNQINDWFINARRRYL